MATLVNKGLEMKAKLLNGVSTAPFTYIALGSGTTAEANDQTALVTEITTNGGARAAATCEYEADYKAKWMVVFSLQEAYPSMKLEFSTMTDPGGTC